MDHEAGPLASSFLAERMVATPLELATVSDGTNVKIGQYNNPNLPTSLATIRAHRITAAWAEDVVTWNSFQGAFSSNVEASFSNGGGGGVTVQFNLKSLVQSWVDGTYPNDGFLLEQGPVNGQTTTFQGSEPPQAQNASSQKPEMTVCYTIPG